MQYMKLDDGQREALLAQLGDMPDYLRASFAGLSRETARERTPEGGFAPVEQVWHLADLEREGFGERIRRLRAEANPLLPDFDGARVAAERGYLSLSLAEGLARFANARAENVAALRAVPAEAWARAGTQAGVGAVALGDLPGMLLQHDAAHRAEIEDWKRQRAGGAGA